MDIIIHACVCSNHMIVIKMADASEDPLSLIKKPSTKSVVWNYFGLQDGRILPDKLMCRVCKDAVLAKGGNTMNLLTHL